MISQFVCTNACVVRRTYNMYTIPNVFKLKSVEYKNCLEFQNLQLYYILQFQIQSTTILQHEIRPMGPILLSFCSQVFHATIQP